MKFSSPRFSFYILQFTFCILFFDGVLAQSVAVESLLKNQLQQLDRQLVLKLPPRSFNSAIIREVEIRTETDDFMLNQQQFQLRLTPTSNRLARAEQRLQQLYQVEANENLQTEKHDFLQAIYEDLLRGYEVDRKLAIERELVKVWQDRERVVEQLSLSGKLAPQEWLATQRKGSKISAAVERYRQELNAIFNSQDLNWQNFIQPENIPGRVTQIINSVTTTAPTTEQQIVAAERDLADAERRRVLDFVNFEYNRSPEDVLREKAAVGAAFILPFQGKRKLKNEELIIEQKALQVEVAVQQQQLTQRLERLQRELLLKYAELKTRRQEAEKLREKSNLIIKRLNQSERATPLLQLEERNNQLETAMDLLEVELEIYQLYLDILEESEVLYAAGLSYFFSAE